MATERPSWKRTLLLLVAGAALPVVAVASATGFLAARIERRIAAPPSGASIARPWGAIDLETFDTHVPSGMQQTIAESIRGEDAREFDRDGDGVRDEVDVCPDTANPGQEDADGDGRGDA